MVIDRPRVLCIDDERDIADTEAMLLDLCGYDAEAFYVGERAVAEALRRRPAACLIDFNMPGMGGCEVARRIREGYDGPPPLLVAVTAMGDDEYREMTAAAGFHEHLVKPVEPERILELLAALDPTRQPRR